ncbi:hypothetical protein KAW44_02000 [Candidatus Bipolaricaulota bacterium]|nr:hypothetical protein [Candidatus Bipolaricaulota bacterium]
MSPPPREFPLLLRHLRAEAHRFAITYHRRLRTRRSLSFSLDERILETLGRP